MRAIGCSNFSAEQTVEAHDAAQSGKLTALVTGQNEYSLLAREIESGLLPEIGRAHV